MAKTFKDIIKTDSQISKILENYTSGVSKLSMVGNTNIPSPTNHHTVDNQYLKDNSQFDTTATGCPPCS